MNTYLEILYELNFFNNMCSLNLQILCLSGRAVNIFPLSSLVNQFRDVRIPRKTQFIMWFSGMFELFDV